METASSQYELLEKVGSGAFGEVFRAKHARSGRMVAVKRLRVSDSGQRLEVLPAAQFQEIEALRQLEHPNVLTIYSAYRELRRVYVGLTSEAWCCGC